MREHVRFSQLPPDSLDQTLDDLVADIQEGKTVVIPTGWFGHATTITLNSKYLAYANRGDSLKDFKPGVHIYSIGNPKAITKEFIRSLIEADRTTDNLQDRMTFLEDPSSSKSIYAHLNLTEIHYMRRPSQKVGNCSWTSAKCALEAVLFLDRLEDKDKDLKDIQTLRKLFVEFIKNPKNKKKYL